MKPLHVIFLFSLILRLSFVFIGYHGDLNNQISWGIEVYENGILNFYERDSWQYSAPNQPPLTILMLGGLVFLWNFFKDTFWYLNNSFGFFPSTIIWFWEDKGMVLLMKLPSIIADIAIGAIIYKYLIFKNFSRRKALLICFVWLLNPVIWYNSSVWGQTDSVVNLLGILSVFTLLQKRITIAFLFYTLSVLFKGSLLYFAPVLFIVAIFQKHKIFYWLRALFVCAFVVLLTCVWFYPKIDVFIWFLRIYTQRFIPGEIGYLSANAFNFWWIVDSGETLDSITYFGLPARIWGFVIPVWAVIYFMYKLKNDFSDKKLFSALAVISFTVFLFMTRIHERYLYPFFPYATLLLAFIPKIWILYFLVSAVHLLNLYHLFWSPSLPFLENVLSNYHFKLILSFANILLYVFVFKSVTKQKV
ncbi:MAG: hypothetical protein N2558_00590 [Patescibacteria group bacterium]|nr:hypothetical protein [Patescibacteria group bacterium]